MKEPLSNKAARKLLTECLENDRVVLTSIHLDERMDERGVDFADIFATLWAGHVSQHKQDENGVWFYNAVTKRLLVGFLFRTEEDGRVVVVATVIPQ